MYSLSRDDSWDDIVFPEKTNTLLRKHKGVFLAEDDLSNSLRDLLNLETFPDDSSSTTSSFVSYHSKLHVSEKDGNSAPRGKVTKLGKKPYRDRYESQIIDWDDDVEIPDELHQPILKHQPTASLDVLEGTSKRKIVSFQNTEKVENENEKNPTLRDQEQIRDRSKSVIVSKYREGQEDFFDGLDISSDKLFRVPGPKKTLTRLPRPTKIPRSQVINTSTSMKHQEVKALSQHKLSQQPCVSDRDRERQDPQTTLLLQPKSESAFRSGRELDSFDNLPNWSRSLAISNKTRVGHGPNTKEPLKSSLSTQYRQKRSETNIDPLRPWRTNMRTPSAAPQKNQRPIVQVRDSDVKYDTNNCHGRRVTRNGQSVFNTMRRPALIRNRTKAVPGSKYAEVVVGNMIFDVSEMRWIKQSDQEMASDSKDHWTTVLDGIEDLPVDESLAVRPARFTHRKTHDKTEFNVQPAIAQHMMLEEQAHEDHMRAWCLSEREPVSSKPGCPTSPLYAYLAVQESTLQQS